MSADHTEIFLKIILIQFQIFDAEHTLIHENVTKFNRQLAIFVIGSHSFELILQEGVAESEGGTGELVEDRRVAGWVVT
jgi:hypothetical protein